MSRDGTGQRKWTIVGASTIGLIVGGNPLMIFTFSVFLKPITEEMHWTRAEASSGISLMLYLLAVASPLFGILLDRYGVRRPLIASILATAAAVAAVSCVQTLPEFLLAFAAIGVLYVGLQPLPYSKVLVGWFDAGRGLALGVANAGQGLGGIILPIIASVLLAHFGWRGAYVGLAIILLIVALPGALFIIREPSVSSEHPRSAPGQVAASPKDAGIISGFAEIFRVRAFWVIVIAAGVLSFGVNGVLPHMVPLLTDRGYSVTQAVSVLSVFGLVGIFGRIGTGFLVDMFFAPTIGVIVFALTGLGIGTLWLASPYIPPVIGVALMGAGLGAELDLMGYLSSRYISRKCFAQAYAIVFCFLIIGQSMGALAMGWCFDVMKTYTPMLAVVSISVFVCGFFLLTLGSYIYPPEKEAPMPADATAGIGIAP